MSKQDHYISMISTEAVNMFATQKLKTIQLWDLQIQSIVYSDSDPPHVAPLWMNREHPHYHDILTLS